MKQFSQLFHN